MTEPFLPQEVIRRKREGKALDTDEIHQFIGALTSGDLSDAQVGAFAMAACLQGMTASECAALTIAMRDSGEVLHWDRQRLRGPVIDKHSTGGVGDCVSLMLAPMLAACGAHVPMISGRGLGHTGGTLDKLSSIPGYQIQPPLAVFFQTVETAGCAIIGPTPDLAPADGRLYAIRDVTATVESAPLITASILSKKLASGLDALVMDIKTGNGAVTPSLDAAGALAESLVNTAGRAGLKTTAVITDMNQPLAPVIGNALEVGEVSAYLTGQRQDSRLHQVVMALGSELLVSAGLALENKQAREKLENTLTDGSAAESFDKMVALLGGPPSFLELNSHYLPRAPTVIEVSSKTSGVVWSIDTRVLGLAVLRLGGGRRQPEDVVDPAVGLDQCLRVGQTVDYGTVLCRIHARDPDQAGLILSDVRDAFAISDRSPEIPPVVVSVLGES
ncbi:MAG: thymidine phosphorylase [Pseudomonadota bacterium]|nr:thymidine phosphorylase [Pseudomonadota bacterium]